MMTRENAWLAINAQVAAGNTKSWPLMEHLDVLDRAYLLQIYRKERREILLGILAIRYSLDNTPDDGDERRLFLTCAIVSMHYRLVEWRKLLRGERAETPLGPMELIQDYVQQKL